MKGQRRITPFVYAALFLGLLAGFSLITALMVQATPPAKPNLNPPWATNVPVSDDPGTSSQESPALAVGTTGNLYAVWRDYRNSASSELYFARSTNQGVTWTANTTVSLAYVGVPPKIAASGPLTVHVAWWQDDWMIGWPIYYNRSADGGQTWGTDQAIKSGDYAYSHLDITADSAGRVYVAWASGSYLNLGRSLDGGTTWITFTHILTNEEMGSWSMYNPALAIESPTGTLHLVWDEETIGTSMCDVCYARSTDQGQIWTDRQCIRQTPSPNLEPAHPDIAVDPASKRIHVVWQDTRSAGIGNEEIYHVSSGDSGISWGAPISISGSGGPAIEPTIAAVGDGVLYVAWQDGRNGDDDIYYSRSADGGQTWNAPSRVNDDATSQPQRHPAIACGSGVYAIWDDVRSGDADIYATRILTCPVSLVGVSITGVHVVAPGVSVYLTGTITPTDVTTPVLYTWSPGPNSGQGTSQARYLWSEPGYYLVNLAAQNCGGTFGASHGITVTCSAPVTGVSISGVTAADAGITVTLTATVTPPGARTPITYTWSPAPDSGQGTAQAKYMWRAVGPHVVTVTATNCSGAWGVFSGTHAVTISDTVPPVWSNFSPSTWITSTTIWGTVPYSVQVVDTGAGLAVSTARESFSTDGGSHWSAWSSTYCPGGEGAIAPQTIEIFHDFGQDSGTTHLNRVKFVITDTAGNPSYSPAYNVDIDTTPPANPAIVSGDRPTGTWNANSTVVMTWSGATDASSGVAGYSYQWSQSATTIPTPTLMTTATTATAVVPDGVGWYFHVRAVDRAGHWAAGAAHQGPYWIGSIPAFLTLDPESGGPGAEVWLAGFGFDSQVTVTVGFTSTITGTVWLGSFQTSYDGTFLVVVNVPADPVWWATHYFIVTGGGKMARAKFGMETGFTIYLPSSTVQPPNSLPVWIYGANSNGSLVLQSDVGTQAGPFPLSGKSTYTTASLPIPLSAVSGTHVLTVTNRINGYIVERNTALFKVNVPAPPPPLTATPAIIRIISPTNKHVIRGDTILYDGVDPLACQNADSGWKMGEYGMDGKCHGSAVFKLLIDQTCGAPFTGGKTDPTESVTVSPTDGRFTGALALEDYPMSVIQPYELWGQHTMCLVADYQMHIKTQVGEIPDYWELPPHCFGSLPVSGAQLAPSAPSLPQPPPKETETVESQTDWILHTYRTVTCTTFTIDPPPRYRALYQLVDNYTLQPIPASNYPQMSIHGWATGFMTGTHPLSIRETLTPDPNLIIHVDEPEGIYTFDAFACHYFPRTGVQAYLGGKGDATHIWGTPPTILNWSPYAGPAPTGVTSDFATHLDSKGQLGPFLSFADVTDSNLKPPVTVSFNILFNPALEDVKFVTVTLPGGQTQILHAQASNQPTFTVNLNMSLFPAGLVTVTVQAHGHYENPPECKTAGDTPGPPWDIPVVMVPAPKWLTKPVSNGAATWNSASATYYFTGTVGNGVPQNWRKDQTISLAFLGDIGNKMAARVDVWENFNVKTGAWNAKAEAWGEANVMCMSADPQCPRPYRLSLTATPTNGVVDLPENASYPGGYSMADFGDNKFHPLTAHQFGPWEVYNGVIASYWGIINVYLSINFGITTDATMDGGFSPDLTPSFTMAPTAAFNGTISLWIDILMGVASAGVDGYATLSFSWPTTVNQSGVSPGGVQACLSLRGRVWVEVLFWDASFGPADIWSTCWGGMTAAMSPLAVADTPPPSIMAAPSLAADGYGHLIGTWVHNDSNHPQQNQGTLYYVYWDGAKWSDGAPAVASNPPSFLLSEPEVAFAGYGKAVAVFASNISATQAMTWTEVKQQVADQQIAYSIFNGYSWSPKQNLTNSAGPSGRMSLAGDPARNRAMAVWVHDVSAGGGKKWQIEYAVFNATTNQWTAPALVAPRVDGTIDAEPSLAFDSTGRAMAVWVRQGGVSASDVITSPFNNNDLRELYTATWNPGTNTWTVSTSSAFPKGALMPSVAFDAQNRPMLAYAINDHDRGGGLMGLGNNNKLGFAVYSQTSWIARTAGDVKGVERPRIIPLKQDLAAILFRGFGPVHTPEFSGAPMAVTVQLNKPGLKISKSGMLTTGGGGWMFAGVSTSKNDAKSSLMTMGVYNLNKVPVSTAMRAATLQNVSASGDDVYALNVPVQSDPSVAANDVQVAETLPLSGTLVPFTVTVRNLGLAPTTLPVTVSVIQDVGWTGEKEIISGTMPADVEFNGSFELTGTWRAISGAHRLTARVYPELAENMDGTNDEATVVMGAPPAPSNLVASRSINPMSIGLAWLPVTGPAMSGYRVYRSTELTETLEYLGWSDMAFFVDESVTLGMRYRYAVSAVTSAGVESALSKEIAMMAAVPVYLPIVLRQ